MKNIIIAIVLLSTIFATNAQEKNIVTVNEDGDKTEVILVDKKINFQDDPKSDTTSVRIGKKQYNIVENDSTTQIIYKKVVVTDNEEIEENLRDFNGHWAGFEMGVNTFYDEDYSLYSGDEFMELDYPKSLEVNINFLEYNIALKKHRIGLVTGMGWSIKNYKFDNSITVDNIEGMIEPVDIESDNLKKTKLTVSYLTVPLLLEFQIPVNEESNHLFISAGVVGGINLGSHTKIKYEDSKTKDHGSFNINPFQYAATARVGLKDISIYCTYSLSPLFKDGKGPELYPFSIGLSVINF